MRRFVGHRRDDPPPRTAAAAVVYDEAVSGDASDASPPVVILGLGRNDLVGSVTWAVPTNVRRDDDAFDLVVGPRLQIVSFRIGMSLRPDGEGEYSGVGWLLQGPGLGFPLSGVPIPSPLVPVFAGVLPLGEGTYRLLQFGNEGRLPLDGYRTADYVIQVQVAAIPLPAGAALLAGALGLLALARLRRRAA